MEELKLNAAIFLVKPDTEYEFYLTLQIKKSKNALDRKDFMRYKNKFSRYNRIISFIIACKHQNSALLEYLLDSSLLKYFWTKKDFYCMLHFISTNSRIWEFALPILM